MKTNADSPRYATPARMLHWLTALCVLLVIPLGFLMMNLPSGSVQDRLFDLHRSIGFLILCLTVLRVVVRIIVGAPAPPTNIPRWEVRVASAVHHLLYLLLLMLPLLGWAASSAFGSQVSVFGLFTLPDIVRKDDALADLFGNAHSVLGYLISVLVVLHIGGGLMHGLRGDGVLGRMLPPSLAR